MASLAVVVAAVAVVDVDDGVNDDAVADRVDDATNAAIDDDVAVTLDDGATPAVVDVVSLVAAVALDVAAIVAVSLTAAVNGTAAAATGDDTISSPYFESLDESMDTIASLSASSCSSPNSFNRRARAKSPSIDIMIS